MIALQLSEDRISFTERRNQIMEGLHNLPAQIKHLLRLDKSLEQLAKTLSNERSLLIMGRGFQHATCLEAALKIKELSYMHSEGILAGELKHGPLALIDEHMPVRVFCFVWLLTIECIADEWIQIVLIMTRDSLYAKTQSALQQIQARKGQPIIIANEGDDSLASDVRCFYVCIGSVFWMH
jgi:glucosamine--fructose-6-phosphate aminotransferase (isomerizing)